MAISTEKISDAKAAVTGAVYVAPKGTSLPTDASTALGSGFETFYSKTDGAVLKYEHNITMLDAWEATDIDVLNEKNTVELTINPLEVFGLNAAISKLMFNASNVTTGTSGAITAIAIDDSLAEECVVVIETILKGNIKQRFVFPRFQCTTHGDITLKRGENEQPSITGTCLAGTDGKKVKAYYAVPVTPPGGNVS